MSDQVLGIDLGGTNIRAGLAPLDGESSTEAARTVHQHSDGIVEQIVALAREVTETARVDWTRIAGMAVGVPGVVSHADGGVGLSPNLPSLGRLDLGAALADALQIPVVLDNDVNLATLAEHRHGRAAGLSDFVFIAVGTGVGMGIMAGGLLQRGSAGAAGEIGFLPLAGDPFDIANQVHGPLEEAAGGGGLSRRYAELAGDRATPTALEIHARASAGDPHAAAVLDEQARAMSLAVVAVQSVLDPELVVFGGGIGSRPDFLQRVRRYVPRLTRRPPRLEASSLGERAGLLGALALARDHSLRTTSGQAVGAGG